MSVVLMVTNLLYAFCLCDSMKILLQKALFKIRLFTEILQLCTTEYVQTGVCELIRALGSWKSQIDLGAIAVKCSIRTFLVVVRGMYLGILFLHPEFGK